MSREFSTNGLPLDTALAAFADDGETLTGYICVAVYESASNPGQGIYRLAAPTGQLRHASAGLADMAVDLVAESFERYD